MLDDRTGFIFLQLEHPLEGDHAVASGEINQLPGLVPLDGVHLQLHRGAPGCVSLRLRKRTQL
jgi:hypothetical protein